MLGGFKMKKYTLRDYENIEEFIDENIIEWAYFYNMEVE